MPGPSGGWAGWLKTAVVLASVSYTVFTLLAIDKRSVGGDLG